MQSINIHTDNGIEWIQWASENEIDDVGYSRQYGEIVSYVVELNKSSILKAQEFLQSNTDFHSVRIMCGYELSCLNEDGEHVCVHSFIVYSKGLIIALNSHSFLKLNCYVLSLITGVYSSVIYTVIQMLLRPNVR